MASADTETHLSVDGREPTACCTPCKRSLILFSAQVIVQLILIIASIFNLTMDAPNRELWVAFLSGNVGILLPNPKINHRG